MGPPWRYRTPGETIPKSRQWPEVAGVVGLGVGQG